MATRHKRTHFIFELIATWIDAFKRELLGGGSGGAVSGSSGAGSAHSHAISGNTAAGSGHTHTFTGTQPSGAVVEAAAGTGVTTAGQVVTTTENFNATPNQYANHWLIVEGEAPALIASHPGAAAAPLVLTIFGLAPPTSGAAFKILRAPTPAGANANEDQHTHGAGTIAAANESAHTHGAGTYEAAAAAAPIHYDVGEFTITTADASNLLTSIALAKAIATALYNHLSDALAHEAADDTNLPNETLQQTLDALVDLDAVIDFANGVKDALNAHFTQSGVHATDDVVRTISSLDATDQNSANTLLNEIKTDLNAHMAAGSAIPSWRVVDP